MCHLFFQAARHHISVEGDALNLFDTPFHEMYQFCSDVERYTQYNTQVVQFDKDINSDGI